MPQRVTKTAESIRKHPHWNQVIGAIERYGNFTRTQLVQACSSDPKEQDELMHRSKGYLLALLISKTQS